MSQDELPNTEVPATHPAKTGGRFTRQLRAKKVMPTLLVLVVGGGAVMMGHQVYRDGGTDPQTRQMWQQLDDSLDASLAGTLAGLALAAAAFIVGKAKEAEEAAVRAGVRKDYKQQKIEEKKMQAYSSGGNNLVRSFYCFVLLLATTFAIDPVSAIGQDWDWRSGTDLGVSVLSISSGVVLMLRGAFVIQKEMS